MPTAYIAPVPDDWDPQANGAHVEPDSSEVAKARPNRSFVEIGSTGLQQYGGRIEDELLQQLKGDRGRRIYREMADNDSVVGAVLFAIDQLVRGVDWRVEARRDRSKPRTPQTQPNPKTKAQLEAEAKLLTIEAKGKLDQEVAEITAGGVVDSAQIKADASLEQAELDAEVTRENAKLQAESAKRQAEAMAKRPAPAPGAFGGGGGAGAPAAAQPRPAAKASGVDGSAVTDTEVTDKPGTEFLNVQEQPAEEKEITQADEIAAFVWSCLEDMSLSWEDLISQILSMLVYGWSYFEIVYKKRDGLKVDSGKSSKYNDGRIGWRKIAYRSQDTLKRWEFDSDDGIKGLWQEVSFSEVFIPIEKSLLFRTTPGRGNPEGRSVLRNAYRSWYFKKRIEELEAIGIERDLVGLPVMWVPPAMLSDNATSAQTAALDEFKRIVRRVKRDEQEGVVFPLEYDDKGNPLYKFELLASGGKRQFNTDEIIGRYEQRMTMTVLADFIMLGHQKVGAFNLGESKLELFEAALKAWLKSIADVFNSHAIPRLLQVNGMDPNLAPELKFGNLEHIDLRTLGEYIVKLSQSQMPLFPDKNLEAHLRRQAGLPGGDGEMVD